MTQVDFLTDLMSRRTSKQVGGWPAWFLELNGATIIEPTAFEPDPTTYRGEYYYSTETNTLYRKVITMQKPGVVVAHWQKASA